MSPWFTIQEPRETYTKKKGSNTSVKKMTIETAEPEKLSNIES